MDYILSQNKLIYDTSYMQLNNTKIHPETEHLPLVHTTQPLESLRNSTFLVLFQLDLRTQ
jgi:hypothetical protein